MTSVFNGCLQFAREALIYSANGHNTDHQMKLHGDETRVWGDSAYSGQGAVIAEYAPRAKDFSNKKGARNRPLSAEDKRKNRTKSKVRAKVEHPFLILKRIFSFNKVRYRGLYRNANRLFVACGLVNLHMARRQLLRPT